MDIAQSLRRARQLRGSEMAVADGEHQISWMGFCDRVQRLCAFFRTVGLKPDDRVMIIAEPSYRYLEVYLAAPSAGGVIVPVNVRLSSPELRQLIGHAEPKIVVSDDVYGGKVHEIIGSHTDIIHIRANNGVPPAWAADALDYETGISSSAASPFVDRQGDDIAAIIYTSGATGEPKGVMLTHHNIIFNALNTIPYLKTTDKTIQLHAAPLFHTGAGQRVFTATIAAASHVVMGKFSPQNFCVTVERHRATSVMVIPTMLQMILDYPNLLDFDLSSLKYISYGGAPMPNTLIRRAMEELPGCQFSQSYGMTELSPVATSLTDEEHRGISGSDQRLETVGRAATTTEIRIVLENGNEAALGEAGEVVVRGPNVMKGYWRRPELTASVLKDGWLHTGDIGRMDKKGYITLLDRKKDMIVSGGENVYSSEVEEIIRRFTGVIDCAVVGLPDSQWGERVHVVIVSTEFNEKSFVKLRDFCKRYLADYKAPRSYTVMKSPLPLTASHKVDKKILRRQCLQATEGAPNDSLKIA